MAPQSLRLPPELVDHILSFVFFSGDIDGLKTSYIATSFASSKEKLGETCSGNDNGTCRMFKALVERWLWRDVGIHSNGGGTSEKCMGMGITAPHLLKLIKTHPRLSSLIHTLRIYLPARAYSRTLVDEECMTLLQVHAHDQVSVLDTSGSQLSKLAISPRHRASRNRSKALFSSIPSPSCGPSGSDPKAKSFISAPVTPSSSTESWKYSDSTSESRLTLKSKSASTSTVSSNPQNSSGPFLPNLRVLALAIEPTESSRQITYPWDRFSEAFRNAFIERLAWSEPMSRCDGHNPYETLHGRGITRVQFQGIEEFRMHDLDRCGRTLKEVWMEGQGRSNLYQELEFLSMDKSSTSTTLTSEKGTGVPLELTHLKIHHCSRSLVDLTNWLTSSNSSPFGASLPPNIIVASRIANLRFLDFHSINFDGWVLLPRILDACQDTLEELSVDWGNVALFSTMHNLLQRSSTSVPSVPMPLPFPSSNTPIYSTYIPPPPPFPPPHAHVHHIPNSHSGFSHPLISPPPPPPLPPPPVLYQTNSFQPPTPVTSIPIARLSALQKLVLKAHVWTESRSMRTSLGEDYEVVRRCRSDVGCIGELLGELSGREHGGRLKDIEINLDLKIQGGKGAPTLEEVDFSAMAEAFEPFDNDDLEVHEAKPITGPIITLAIHPAIFIPPSNSYSSSSESTRIPFAELTSSISNNGPLMGMVRRGRVVVKGMVMVREWFGENIQEEAQEILRERVWRGEVGWGG